MSLSRTFSEVSCLMYASTGSFCSPYASVVVSCSPYTFYGASCSPYAFVRTFCFIFAFLRTPIFLCWGLSFELIGLPCFRRILDSFSNYHSRISIRIGIFTIGIYDFVTFFVSIKASGK